MEKQNPIPRPKLTESELKAKDKAFMDHLKWVSEQVRTWPAWKQEILGGRAVRQNETDKHQYKLWEE